MGSLTTTSLSTTIVGKHRTSWDIQRQNFVTNTEFNEGFGQNIIARSSPKREIMGHDFDDAMVHWRLVGRNTSWAGQFSSQERNQEPRLILPGQANSHETLLKHSEQDGGLLLFIVAVALCLVFIVTLFAVFFSFKLTQCCSHQKPLQKPTCSCKLSRKLGSGYIHQHDEANVIPV